MNIDPTASNRSLAAAVNSRINADARIVSAKAAMWRLAGVGILAALAGVGAGAALYGYASIHDASNTAERLAGAISTAIEKAHLTGEVRMAPEQSVSLDPKAEVGLRKGGEVGVHGSVSLEDGGLVRVDPNSRIEATGAPGTTGSIPHPSEKQIQGQGSVPRQAAVVRNYTIFTSVPFGDGSVVTGWVFETSEQAQPTQQYCYYGTPVQDAVQVRVDLAYDGVAIPVRKPNGFDAGAAVAQCSWFDGSATRHTTVELPQSPPKPRRPAETDDWCQGTSPGTIRTWCIEEFGRNGTPPGDRKGKAY